MPIKVFLRMKMVKISDLIKVIWICIRFLLVWFLYKIRSCRSLCIWGKTRGGDTNFS